MKLFIKSREDHTIVACPAGDSPAAEHPVEWLNADGSPKVFPIRFSDGKAEVPDHIGKYLIERGIAAKSALNLGR